LLIGADFSTGNLGVSSLAWSSIKIIRARWPNVRIVLLASGRKPGVAITRMGKLQEEFATWPVRYCANLLASNHIARLWLSVVICRFFPFLKQRLAGNKSTFGELLRCNLICDITGGDSFSDIYGLPRFFRGYLLKRVCQMTGKPFILLPQTYGPFKARIARILARNTLKMTTKICSRDQEGLVVVEDLIGVSQKVKLYPDVAFIMEPNKPTTASINHLENMKRDGKQLIGLNISGLLYHGGYTRDNMFGLKCDYPALVKEIIAIFTRMDNQHVLLVPHVLPSTDLEVEDDFLAAGLALKELPPETQQKVILLEKGYDQNETKYIIGLCDFFLGARMHATIAAISQRIPAVALAYSRKFTGVFETAGIADCVIDLRNLQNEQILDRIMEIYHRRDQFRTVLEKNVPELQVMLLTMFDGINIPAEKE